MGIDNLSKIAETAKADPTVDNALLVDQAQQTASCCRKVYGVVIEYLLHAQLDLVSLENTNKRFSFLFHFFKFYLKFIIK